MNDDDFRCSHCGTPIEFGYDPPKQALCERCCDLSDGHDYIYDSSRGGHFCKRCDKPRPFDW